jgi:hypothetical protein
MVRKSHNSSLVLSMNYSLRGGSKSRLCARAFSNKLESLRTEDAPSVAAKILGTVENAREKTRAPGLFGIFGRQGQWISPARLIIGVCIFGRVVSSRQLGDKVLERRFLDMGVDVLVSVIESDAQLRNV